MSVPDVNHILVDRQEALDALAERLGREPAFGLDTESNSLYRYCERVCLIQISVPGADYVVDPLAVDPGPLRAVLASAEVQKVMHAGEYDIMCLRRDYGFDFCNVFDTMIAARTLGLDEIGLAPLLKQHFGVALSKRLQRANWEQRPLPPPLLQYAALDSHYLLRLRDLLLRRLQAERKLAEAEASFQEVCRACWRPKEFDPEGYLRLSGARKLGPRERLVLRELYRWREEAAQQVDRPPFRVARSDVLLRLSMLQPKSVSALEMVAPRNDGLVLQRAQEVLECIRRGQAAEAAEPGDSRARRRGPSLRQRVYDRLHRWRREQAERLGLPMEKVLASEALSELADRRPRTRGELEALGCLAPAQLQRHGGAILALLNADGGSE
ncbi:MAG: ribonuclease D [Anaerolineae bacterium]|nr:ribonuclease D [Anaerolineae bacterium]